MTEQKISPYCNIIAHMSLDVLQAKLTATDEALRAEQSGHRITRQDMMQARMSIRELEKALRVTQGDAAILRGLFVRFRALEGANDRGAMRLLLKDIDTYLAADTEKPLAQC